MHHTRLLFAAVSLAALSALAPAAIAQTAPDAEAAPTGLDAQRYIRAGFTPPRTETGRPDFQGVWTNASVTRLTRPDGYPLVLSDEQADQLEGGSLFNQRLENEASFVDPDEGAPEAGRALPPVGNYDVAWTDPGSTVANINGELRSSFLVYPADGQVPALTEAGRQARQAAPRRRGTGYDHPEERGLSERCVVIGVAGPPLGQYLYNNNLQIVQTGSDLVLMTEMIHDARIIRIGEDEQHVPEAIEPWMGDSIAHWDGDTLVVETANIHPEQRTGATFISPTGKITERFTRISESQLLYQFEVNDPAYYTDVWRAEMPLYRLNERIHEYACHEGNYGLENILSGGRWNDRMGIDHTGGEDRGE